MIWLFELFNSQRVQPDYKGEYDTHLTRGHIFDNLSSHPRPFFRALLLVPFSLPESMRGEVIEYEYGRRENECFLGHRAVCNEMSILPGETEHPRCRLSSDTIQ